MIYEYLSSLEIPYYVLENASYIFVYLIANLWSS